MEVHEKPDIRIPGVEYINIPLFCESAIGLTLTVYNPRKVSYIVGSL